jgi:hypothetical protein
MPRFFVVFVVLLWAAAPGLGSDYLTCTFAGGAPQETPVAAINASVGIPLSVAVDAAGEVFFTGDRASSRWTLRAC